MRCSSSGLTAWNRSPSGLGDRLPYDRFSPYQDIVSERLATRYRLPELPGGIVIPAVTTLMQRLPP